MEERDPLQISGFMAPDSTFKQQQQQQQQQYRKSRVIDDEYFML